LMATWGSISYDGVSLSDPAIMFESDVNKVKQGPRFTSVNISSVQSPVWLSCCSYCGALVRPLPDHQTRHAHSHRLVLWALDGFKTALGALGSQMNVVAQVGLKLEERLKSIRLPEFKKAPSSGGKS